MTSNLFQSEAVKSGVRAARRPAGAAAVWRVIRADWTASVATVSQRSVILPLSPSSRPVLLWAPV